MLNDENLPWIEKYEPNSLQDILGNNLIIERLKNMKVKNNLSNIILIGPSGIGKTKCIECLAKDLLQENYDEAVLKLDGSEDRGINTIRCNLKSFAQKKVILPENRYKLVILDEADSINVSSQQALRRIIENYSHNTRFIFICNDISKIIEAIQSRSTMYKMNKLEKRDIVSMIEKICIEEKIYYTNDSLEYIYKHSNGDMRQAINNLENIYYCYNNIKLCNVKNLLCCNEYDLIKNIFKRCSEGNIREACKLIDDLLKNGYSDGDIVNLLFNHLKNNEKTFDERKINNILKLSLKYIKLNEGYTNKIFLYGLMSNFCNSL